MLQAIKYIYLFVTKGVYNAVFFSIFADWTDNLIDNDTIDDRIWQGGQGV